MSSRSKILTKQLKLAMTPLLYQGFDSIYKDAVKKSKENTESRGELYEFQGLLNDIRIWDTEMIEGNTMLNHESNRIISSVDDFKVDELYSTSYYLQLADALTALNMEWLDSYDDVPSYAHFVHKCYRRAANQIYRNPYLMSRSDKFSPKQIQENMRLIVEIIGESIDESLRMMLPINTLIQDFNMESLKELFVLEHDMNESDQEGSDQEGSDQEGSDQEGSDQEGSDEGSDQEGSDEGSDQEGSESDEDSDASSALYSVETDSEQDDQEEFKLESEDEDEDKNVSENEDRKQTNITSLETNQMIVPNNGRINIMDTVIHKSGNETPIVRQISPQHKVNTPVENNDEIREIDLGNSDVTSLGSVLSANATPTTTPTRLNNEQVDTIKPSIPRPLTPKQLIGNQSPRNQSPKLKDVTPVIQQKSPKQKGGENSDSAFNPISRSITPTSTPTKEYHEASNAKYNFVKSSQSEERLHERKVRKEKMRKLRKLQSENVMRSESVMSS